MGTKSRVAALDVVIVISVFAAGTLTVPFLNPILRHGHRLSGAALAEMYQFCLEGAAPLTMMLLRRERLADYGLRRRYLGRSLCLAFALAAIYDGAFSLHRRQLLWIPLFRQPALRMAIAGGLAAALSGSFLVIFTWGAAEAFFGVYLSRNFAVATRTATRGWITPGVLFFAVFNGLIHILVGQGFEGFFFSFASGFAIAVIPSVTANAWGSLVVQTLTNAIGS